MTETSVDVPPISKASNFLKPVAAKIIMVEVMPPAGRKEQCELGVPNSCRAHQSAVGVDEMELRLDLLGVLDGLRCVTNSAS